MLASTCRHYANVLLMEGIPPEKQTMSSRAKRREARGKNISTFCRIKPPESDTYELKYQIVSSFDASAKSKQLIQFNRSKSASSNLSSSKGRRSQEFTFNEIFKEDSSQVEIFDTVGQKVIDNALKGFNGTIFAYGQTATGKTYTIMGEDLEDEFSEEWGLIPRAIYYIFEHLRETNHRFNVEVSFLEIYNESMFDLLDVLSVTYEKKSFLRKNRVFCKMNDDTIRLDGLSYRKAEDEGDAMNAFIEGYENREVAETYANNTSSRSHAVFTIYIQREDETGTIESKLHFVDLAGSERVSKDFLGSSKLIAEAKEINRSLLFLHKVIKSIALGHQPETFRNTMITKILRDSLIGNSMTSLVATISIDEENYEETVATCDFAQSVSKIKTKPVKNKTEDLNRIIATLQEENERLKAKLMELENPMEPTDEEKENLKKIVVAYYNEDSFKSSLAVRENDGVSQFCFRELKSLGKNSEQDANVNLKPTALTDSEKKELDEKLYSFIGENDTDFQLGNNPSEAQYCLQRLKHIIKEYDDRPAKKKGCC